MSPLELGLTHLFSAVVIGLMLGLCLRSRSREALVAVGRRTYRVHPGWYVFCALGGVMLVGIFAYASTVTIPENQKFAVGASLLSAVGFVLAALIFRAAAVTLDDNTLTSRTLIGERTVSVRSIESVNVVGLVVEVKFRTDPATNRRPKSLNFMAGFRGLGELLATLRARAGLPPTT